MDLYVVSNDFEKTDVVDSFDSLIWTERYNASGDVTLALPATAANQNLIAEDVFLHTPDSPDIMLIDTVNIKNKVLIAKGQSLVDFFKSRMFRNRWQGDQSSWTFTSTAAGTIINTILARLISPGTWLTDGTVLTSAQGLLETFPSITVSAAVAGDPIALAINYGTVYDAIKQAADADSLGFSLYPPALDGSGNLTFKTYRGLDRTTFQTDNTPVIFDPAMDNISDVEEIRSLKEYKNVAYVWPNGITSQSQVVEVLAPGAGASSLFGRRSMMVQASDINVADYSSGDLVDILTSRGLDALIQNNYIRTVDGQIVPQNDYVYGTHYGLGDILELRGTSQGLYSKARVTEYIRTQDATGEQSYPTLSVII